MTIGKYKRDLNKWQFHLTIARRAPWFIGFSPYFEFAILKLISLPSEGEILGPENYKGFLIRKHLNIEYYQWLIRVNPNRWYVIKIPIKVTIN